MDQDLNVKAKTKELLNGNIGINLHDLRFGKRILIYKTKSMSKKRKKINDLDFIHILKYCASKDTFKKVKRTHRRGENICKLYIS